MKKILFLMLAAVTLLASCQKDFIDSTGDGGEVDVTISATMSGTSATTRSESESAPGDGTTVDRCILEVYTSDGSLYTRMVTSVDNKGASFDVRLVSSQTYDFLLWADKSGFDGVEVTDVYADGHYKTDNTDGLKGITTSYEGYVGNDEGRDAFYCAKTGIEITATTSISAELTRPFGQVNVKTYLTNLPKSMYPKSVKIDYTTKVYDTFNVSDGTLSGNETDFSWSAAAPIMDDSKKEVSNYIDLSTDYLFASAEEQDLHFFTMTFYSDQEGTDENKIISNDNFTSIPVQRNYQTNISGELLTKLGSISVTISSDFKSTNDVTIDEVPDIEKANEVIAKATDDVNIKITEEVSGTNGNTIELPEETESSNVNSVTVDFSALASDTDIVIGDSTGEDYDGTINIIVSSETQAKSITVNAENAHVTFYGTSGEVYSNTSETTFVVLSGSSIGTLTVNGGNVEIYGEVSTIVVDNTAYGTIKVYDGGSFTSVTPVNYTLYQAATTEADLTSLLSNDNVGGVLLTSDFTFTSASSISKPILIEGDLTIEGGNNTLRMSGAGHFVVKGSATMNNMSIASTTTIRTGTIYVEDANSKLYINNSTIDYNTTGANGDLNDGIIVVNPASGIDNVDVVIYNSTLNLNSTYQAAVSFMPTVQQYGSSLTLDNTVINATQGGETSNATYTTGLSLGKVDGFKFDMKNYSEINNVYYGFYGYEWYQPTNIDIDITDSYISGFGIMLRGETGTFDIKNSTIIGRNFYDGTTNNFATIVLAGNVRSDDNITTDPATKDIAMTIDNSTIKAYRAGTSTQYAIDVRVKTNTGNTINIINGSKIIEEVADDVDYALLYLIQLADEGDTEVTTDGTEILEGDTDVRLLLAINFAGSGTFLDPYQISKAYEMTGAIGDANTYYKLMNDIDMTGYTSSFYMQNAGSVFDGGGHTIRNYHVTGSGIPIGLIFDYCKGTVQNLKIEDSSITVVYSSTSKTGGLAGYLSGTIQDCDIDVDVCATSSSSTIAYVGGYAGSISSGTIQDCIYRGTIEIHESQTGTTYAAGFAGYSTNTSSSLINCEFVGSVSGDIADPFYCYNANNSTTKQISDSNLSGNTSSGTVNSDIYTYP